MSRLHLNNQKSEVDRIVSTPTGGYRFIASVPSEIPASSHFLEQSSKYLGTNTQSQNSNLGNANTTFDTALLKKDPAVPSIVGQPLSSCLSQTPKTKSTLSRDSASIPLDLVEPDPRQDSSQGMSNLGFKYGIDFSNGFTAALDDMTLLFRYRSSTIHMASTTSAYNLWKRNSPMTSVTPTAPLAIQSPTVYTNINLTQSGEVSEIPSHQLDDPFSIENDPDGEYELDPDTPDEDDILDAEGSCEKLEQWHWSRMNLIKLIYLLISHYMAAWRRFISSSCSKFMILAYPMACKCKMKTNRCLGIIP
ncbi:hypothetical protein ACMFMF_011677 [Clarireedia jacksonii]